MDAGLCFTKSQPEIDTRGHYRACISTKAEIGLLAPGPIVQRFSEDNKGNMDKATDGGKKTTNTSLGRIFGFVAPGLQLSDEGTSTTGLRQTRHSPGESPAIIC